MATDSSHPLWHPDLDRATCDGASTVQCWRNRANDLLSRQECVFHRNGEISALYAALYLRHPDLYKWAGMAAFASHHARLALVPLKLDADDSGAVDVPRSLRRWTGLHMRDVDLIRRVNNAIFDDVFWMHLAYDGSTAGMARVRGLEDTEALDPRLVAAFASLDDAREALAEGAGDARDRVWRANAAILRHEQEAIVQPLFDELTPAFAQAFSLGAGFGLRVRGIARAIGLFTSFYGYTLTRGLGRALARRRRPLVTRLDDRWDWIERAILPRFRRYEEGPEEMTEAMRWIIEDAATRSSDVVCDIRVMPPGT